MGSRFGERGSGASAARKIVPSLVPRAMYPKPHQRAHRAAQVKGVYTYKHFVAFIRSWFGFAHHDKWQAFLTFCSRLRSNKGVTFGDFGY